jgi:hypothetical protein
LICAGATCFRVYQQQNALDDALDNGVITKAEYDRKVAALVAQRRAKQQASN